MSSRKDESTPRKDESTPRKDESTPRKDESTSGGQVCRYCARAFTPSPLAHCATLYCSDVCREKMKRESIRNPVRRFKCVICGTDVATRHPRQTTCGGEVCREVNKRNKIAESNKRRRCLVDDRATLPAPHEPNVFMETSGRCTGALREAACARSECRYHLPMDQDRNAGCALFAAWNEGGMTLEDVANALGVTRERVRQIEARALSKLKRRTHLRPFVDKGNISTHTALEA